MRRLFTFALSLALTASAAACTDSTGPAGALSGTYTLRSVNNQPPPVTIINTGSFREDVLDGEIIIKADGTYIDRVTLRDTQIGQPVDIYTDEIQGFWSLSGNQLQLTDADDPSHPSYATVTGSTMTFTDFNTGALVVYSK